MSQKPHSLSVKALIACDTQERLVLRRSAQSQNNAGLWDLPGGKCEPGEPMEVALTREVAEETGLQVQLARFVGSTQADLPDRVVVYLVFEAKTVGGELKLSSEHDAHEWRSPHKLAELTFPAPLQDFLRDYARAARRGGVRPLFNKAWYEAQIDTYRTVKPIFDRLARHLIRRLEDATASLGLHCIVQARAKTIASFAEKIMRPGRIYPHPVSDLTDLCGARVICHSLGGVKAVNLWIEKQFTFSREDSGDKLADLAASEFGYRSQHYIVDVPLGELDLQGLPMADLPADLLDKLETLKAEVQVRTILQHAWADIHHELSYKNRFKLPFDWQREFARLAAVLEEADRSFDSIGVGLAEYASSYDAYYTEAQVVEEMDKLDVVLRADRQPAVAHLLARMAILKGEWQRAIDALEPFRDSGPAALLRDLGVSLCKQYRKAPDGSEFQRGQALLEKAIELDPTDVDAPASLAGTWRRRAASATDPDRQKEYQAKAKHWYQRAFELDPTHPYPVGNYVEYALATQADPAEVVSHFQPALRDASERCRKQAEVGVNRPWAYFDLGKFQLMLRQPYEALGDYAKGVADSTAAFFLDSALASFPILAGARLEGLEWCRGFLELAKAIRFGVLDAGLPQPTPDLAPLSAPVVIVTGYCDRPASDGHRTLFKEAFRDFQGTIVSGGTAAGISAVVGEVQELYGTAALRTIGYVPAQLPEGVSLDSRYAEHRHTDGLDFSPLEPLRYWADLLASRVPIDQVRLLAVGGGRITTVECQMALALGARVGVVRVDGSAVAERLAERPWSSHPRLQPLAANVASVRRFLASN